MLKLVAGRSGLREPCTRSKVNVTDHRGRGCYEPESSSLNRLLRQSTFICIAATAVLTLGIP